MGAFIWSEATEPRLGGPASADWEPQVGQGSPTRQVAGGGRRWFGHAGGWSACQRSDAAGPARVADAPCARDVDERPPARILAVCSRALSPPTAASPSPGRSGCGLRRPGRLPSRGTAASPIVSSPSLHADDLEEEGLGVVAPDRCSRMGDGARSRRAGVQPGERHSRGDRATVGDGAARAFGSHLRRVSVEAGISVPSGPRAVRPRRSRRVRRARPPRCPRTS